LATPLVAGAVVATVFNDLSPVLPVGELSKDLFIYMVPFLLLLLLRDPRVIEVPVTLMLLVLAFLGTLLLGIIVNYDEIAVAYFKGRSGMSRVITQGMSVVFGLLITVMFYNFSVQGYLAAILRGARVALVVMGVVGLLEVSYWYSVPGLAQAYEALSLVIHAGSSLQYPLRLRSTAFEVSWAAVMLTFVFPFAIAGATRRMAPIYVILVIVLTLLAQSRTALLVVGSQMLLLSVIVQRRRFDLVVHGVAVACLGVIAVLLAPGVRDEVGDKLSNAIRYGSLEGPAENNGGDENVSNVTRLAAVRAGLVMFKEHPFLGVGLGQYGFNYPGAIQAEDLRSYEVQSYVVDADLPIGWPPAYSIHVRLLAETGLLGYAVWLLLVLPPLVRSFRRADGNTFIGRVYLAAAMTILGWLFLGVSIDSFRFFGGWMALGIALSLSVSHRFASSDTGPPARDPVG
jgi:O-antigen ligase